MSPILALAVGGVIVNISVIDPVTEKSHCAPCLPGFRAFDECGSDRENAKTILITHHKVSSSLIYVTIKQYLVGIPLQLEVQNMKTVGLYVRVSSKKQLKGHSLQTQIARLSAAVSEAAGNKPRDIRVYEERGFSGELPPDQFADEYDRGSRRALTELLRDAEAGELGEVYFYSVSRLAREKAIFFQATKMLQRLGVKYRFHDVNVDPTTPEGSAMIGMHAVFRSWQLEMHKRRIADAYAKRREDGYPPGGQPPYGLQWENRADVPERARRGWIRNDEQAAWAIFMKERYLAGWTTSRIAEHLTELGVSRPSGKHCNWDSSAVGKVLRNPFLAGLITHPDGSLTEGQHFEERLWDPEERERVMKRLTRNRRTGASTVVAAHYPLGGIITCAQCDKRLYCATQNGTRHYYCKSGISQEDGGCGEMARKADKVEKAVMTAIRDLATSDRVQHLASEQIEEVLGHKREQLQDHRQQLVGKRDETQQRVDRLTDMRTAGELTGEQFVGQKDRLWEHIEELNTQIEQVTEQIEAQGVQRAELEQVRRMLQDFPRIWDQLDDDERKEALHTIIERCSLERAEGNDLLMRLKLPYLPEQEIPMPSAIKRRAETGVWSLSLRELAYLWHRRAGLDEERIAKLWDTCRQNVLCKRYSIRERLGVEDMDEAVRMASDRLDDERHALPLMGRVRPRNTGRNKLNWTKKRLQILQGLSDGVPREGIRDQQGGITAKTLSERIRRMKRHAGVDSPEELVEWAKQEGILDS